MNIVLQKQLSSLDGDVKYPGTYHEQRIPSFEVSLLSPTTQDEVAGTVQVIQSAAVVSVIASQSQNSSAANSKTDHNFSPGFDRQDAVISPQSPGVVPTNSVNSIRSSSSSRLDQREINAFCGVVYQDHNYGAPMPFPLSTISCPPQPTSCSVIENDDLPAKLVPLIIAQPVKSIDTPVTSNNVQNSISVRNVRVNQVTPTSQPPEKIAVPKMTKKQQEIASHDSCRHYDVGDIEKPKTSGTRCICGFLHDDGYMCQCECCTAWQHVACYGLSKESLKKSYFCEICDPREVNRSRAISIQERKVKRGTVKSAQKKEVVKKTDDKKNNNVEKKRVPGKASPTFQPQRSHQKTGANTVSQSVVSLLGASSPGNNEASLQSTVVSREERKLLAIMKQFEEMEKRTREKSEYSTAPEDTVGPKKSADDARQPSPPTPLVNKSQQNNSKARKAKASPNKKTMPSKFQKKNQAGGRCGLATMLKKRSKTAVKKLQTKIKGRPTTKKRKASSPNVSSSSLSSSSASSTTNAIGNVEDADDRQQEATSKKDVVPSASNSINLPGSVKKRWLFAPESDETGKVATTPIHCAVVSPTVAISQAVCDSHPLLGARVSDNNSLSEPNISALKGFSLFPNPTVFDSRVGDAAPSVTVASPPGSPEPVLAPLKKRYARTESTSTPVVESVPITPITTVSQPREFSIPLGDVTIPPICQELPISPVPLQAAIVSTDSAPPATTISTQSQQLVSFGATECKIETLEISEKPQLQQQQLSLQELAEQSQPYSAPFSLEATPSCPANEPPAKRKVSLKEYKQRIREHPEINSSAAQPKTPCEVNGTEVFSRNGEAEANGGVPSAPLNSDAAMLPSSATPSERLLDLNNDDDDILVAPLPSADFHLSGLQQPTAFENSTASNVDQQARDNSASKGYARPHSRRRQHRQHAPAAGSDLRVIIPTKAERVAKLKRVDRWLDDVLMKNDDSCEQTADELTGAVDVVNSSTEETTTHQRERRVDQLKNLVTFEKMEIAEDVPTHASSVPNALTTATLTTNTTISTASVDDVSHSSAPHSPQYMATAATNHSNVTDNK